MSARVSLPGRARLCQAFALLLGVLLAFASQAQEHTLIYPRSEVDADPRETYPLQLLALGFEKAAVRVTLRASTHHMPQSRALKLLAEGRDIGLVWTMTSKEREAALLPVRIPILKGLIGWRIALVAGGKPSPLQDVSTVQELRLLRAGQGHDWPDTAILRANHLTVESVSDYEALFNMLAKRRFDYFPRSIIEIQPEWTQHRNLDLQIDPAIALHYPTASYFFFNKGDTALAAHLERGLNRALADGSFDALFFQHHRQIIDAARLDKRRIIRLVNPALPPETPLHRPELWFDPAR